MWICAIDDARTWPIYIWPNATENVTDGTLEDALKQFNEYYQIRGWLICPHKITDKVIEICNRLTEGVDKWHCTDGFYLFYMNTEQQKKFCEKKVELPSEFRFDDVRPDSDRICKWERYAGTFRCNSFTHKYR
ncbi:unnamed protein product [Anisakis simplex]|uniref:Uncharacterized protein n=1 Tax=Anisakis simplex TaxID=6269 RepID=A0A3P6NR56_ANISI|nr:unnamed protein product [Anisakis simplex]